MSDYQQLLAELPCGWSTLLIEEIGEVISGGTPSRNNPRYWGGEIPWVTPGEVTGFGRKHLEKTDEKITTEGLAQSGAKLLPANSLLVTTRASLGAAVLNATPATTNQGFKSIAFTKHFSPDYYYHWSTKLKDELVRLASGTTFLEISGSQFRKILVPVPPRVEQEKIAHILDTLDTQIQKTEALIAKLEKVKEGLLHDLLTRGIDESGRLRPRPEQAPELYKESPLGLIPREWSPNQLGNLINKERPIVYGILMPGYGWPDGIPVVKVKDIKNGEINKENLLLTSPVIDRQYARSKLKEGDLLFTIRGTVGRTAIVPLDLEDANITQDTARISLKEDGAEFIRHYLGMPAPKIFIDTHTIGVAVKGINLGEVRKIPVPEVPEPELAAITSRISSFLKRLQDERASLYQLNLTKAGLMDDLLTGRVRVTPLLEQAQATTPA